MKVWLGWVVVGKGRAPECRSQGIGVRLKWISEAGNPGCRLRLSLQGQRLDLLCLLLNHQPFFSTALKPEAQRAPVSGAKKTHLTKNGALWNFSLNHAIVPVEDVIFFCFFDVRASPGGMEQLLWTPANAGLGLVHNTSIGRNGNVTVFFSHGCVERFVV